MCARANDIFPLTSKSGETVRSDACDCACVLHLIYYARARARGIYVFNITHASVDETTKSLGGVMERLIERDRS